MVAAVFQSGRLALILACMSFVACGGGADEEEKKITGQETLEQQEQTTPEDKAKDQPASGAFSWDNIPVYPGAVLESTGECPPQWVKCEICEHRAYVTEDTPETMCSFYKEGMPGKGWDKIVFQSYPEGSCMGTWLSSDSETRVLMNISKRRGDKKTYIGITIGKKCP